MENDYSSDYIIPEGDPAEMARLIRQEALITRGMGGPLPKDIDLSSVHDILDLASGPGGWAMEVAHNNPEKTVTGIDIDRRMVAYAQNQARIQKLTNISFLQGNIRQHYFPNDSFDLIHARLLVGAIHRDHWLDLWQQYFQVLRPGGLLLWVEGELGQSSSAAYEELNGLTCKAMYQIGQSFSPSGRYLGLEPRMSPLLVQVGFECLDLRSYPFNGSFGTEGYEQGHQASLATARLLATFLLKTGVVDKTRLETLLTQLEQEVTDPSYCSLSSVTQVIARRP